ncbi:MAG: hypothetical protein RR543_02155 [Erysipelotrichales bacterium]
MKKLISEYVLLTFLSLQTLFYGYGLIGMQKVLKDPDMMKQVSDVLEQSSMNSIITQSGYAIEDLISQASTVILGATILSAVLLVIFLIAFIKRSSLFYYIASAFLLVFAFMYMMSSLFVLGMIFSLMMFFSVRIANTLKVYAKLNEYQNISQDNQEKTVIDIEV